MPRPAAAGRVSATSINWFTTAVPINCVAVEPESSDDFDVAVPALHAAEMVSLDADSTA
ncbi:hypothetical protein [Thiorhodococcus drewsii]|uniref:hypothetical protein n=1 Tax=Thiorhodococcus drewsii TaxID=210408 RepID=UPI00156621C9|nr:hypothetical protein [Thiorhodococcus drewsii]